MTLDRILNTYANERAGERASEQANYRSVTILFDAVPAPHVKHIRLNALDELHHALVAFCLLLP
jgi:hypothetical protein